MTGAVFFETLRRNWRLMILWSAGVAAMAIYLLAAVPDSATLKQYGDLMKSMPKVLLFIGATDAAQMATPAGFLAFGFFGWIMLVFAFYAVTAGLDITSNEEDRGIMDVLLSLPIPRWRIIAEKFLAYALLLVGMLLMSWIVLVIGTSTSDLWNVGADRLTESTFNMFAPVLLTMAFTVLMTTILRRRGVAAGITAMFVLASYFVNTVGSSVGIEGIRILSYFRYYDPIGVMAKGLVWTNVIGLLVVTVLLFAGSIWAFQRRDVGV